MSHFTQMNGLEMNDYLDGLCEKFGEWHRRNRFTVSFDGIKKWTEHYDLDTDKEKIYTQTIAFVQHEANNIVPEALSKVLDSFYRTTYFSKLYNTYGETLDHDFETTFAIEEVVLSNMISYELVTPSGALIWKVDGIRLLFDDYILTAGYRVMNKWGFVVTGLLIIVALGSGGLWCRCRFKKQSSVR